MEMVVVALYLLGGANQSIDTEDVAMKANALAPGRFAWKKYKNQINLEAIRVFLSDAKKPKNGCLLAGSGKTGWRLTAAGARLGKQTVGPFAATATPAFETAATRTWLDAERRRLRGSDAVATAKSRGVDLVSASQLEDFFRVDDYVVGDARAEKIRRLLYFFATDEEIGDLVKQFADRISK